MLKHMCFVTIIERLFRFLLFKSYDCVAFTLGCKLGRFYHKLTYAPSTGSI